MTLKFKSDYMGVNLATLAFEFKKDTLSATRPFHIVRFIEAVCRSELAAQLGPTEPFKPQRLETNEPMRCNIDEGIPPERWEKNHSFSEINIFCFVFAFLYLYRNHSFACFYSHLQFYPKLLAISGATGALPSSFLHLWLSRGPESQPTQSTAPGTKVSGFLQLIWDLFQVPEWYRIRSLHEHV